MRALIREGLDELQGFSPAAAASRLLSVGAAHMRKEGGGSGGGDYGRVDMIKYQFVFLFLFFSSNRFFTYRWYCG